ncbi:alpha/beta hydrolase [Mycolicibacterium brisbanense]|uniref:Putative esterase family protein n=1 Tax=Mycolicibacterium brisbanense TaxID=146020 RepID=A0A100VXN3_9MYCO|nr:putative esterase family protein [Mycolicibacterium brisbanense]
MTVAVEMAEPLRHRIAQLSLVDGWVPIAVQVLAALLLLYVMWAHADRRGWRRLAIAALIGTPFALWARHYISSIGVSGEAAPSRLWLWIGLVGAALSLIVLTWKRASWWRRGASVLAVPLCLVCAALSVNTWVGYYPKVRTAWNQLTTGPLPDQTDRVGVTAMQLSNARPDRGVVLPVRIDSSASGFAHRREFAYLPPIWFASKPPPRLPAVMMIGSALNTPADWLRVGNAVATLDDFATQHDGSAPAVVFVDATGAFDNDTECVNGPRGNAADHLTKDVAPFMAANFGVSAERTHWGIAGWSMGGTCAVDLAVMHPDLFSAFVDIAGDIGPNTGGREHSIATLFGGDADAWAAFDPTTVMKRHGRYTGLSGWFEVPGSPDGTSRDPVSNPEGQDVAARSLSATAATQGITSTVVTRPGRHDWLFASQAFADALPWLAAQLGTPAVPRVAMPNSTTDAAGPTGIPGLTQHH